MFEKILEKVLLNNVGQFIDGIDKNNLKIGIWSGDIVIKDIAVKPEILAMLDIPVKMMFSYVGKLSVSVPWKSLGSKPVEIALEDVYVILEPLDQNSWKGLDYKSVSKRIELMESFVQSYVTKLAEKAALENKDAKKEDQGMVARLTERVIDNIQITVRNIHVRFENPLSKRKYAWGITLDEILVYTTNNKWEREFVDRTESKNSLEPMRKMLSLKNLGVYWASDVPQLFAHMSAQNIKQFMKDLILNDKTDPKQKLTYIIAISATCKLTQKNKKDPAAASLPEFDVSLNLKPLNLQLKKPQLEDVIRLLEFMNGYQRFKLQAMKEREKEVAALTADEKEKMKLEFTELFGRVHRSEKAKDLKGEPKVVAALEVESDVDKFNNLVMSMADEDLSVIIKDVVRDVEKERRTKALEAQKASQTEKKGWFGWGSSKKTETSQSTQLDAEDQAAIEKALEEAFGGEKEEDVSAKLEQLAYQPLFSISFTLEGGDFYFSNITPQQNEEGVTLSYKGLSAKIDVNSKGQSVNVTLKDYGVYLRTRYAGTTTYTDTPIIRRLNHWMPPEAAGNMISLLFEQNPQGKEEGTYINLDSQAAEIVFRPVAIERLVSFFDVSTEDEALKTRALQVKEKYQDQASQAASQAAQSNAKKNISIKFAAPVLVIPFLQNADIQSECWVINLGDLRVNTQDEETKLYERFALGLENLTFQYYPSQSLYMKVMRSLKEKGDLSELKEEDREEQCRVFNLIQQFNIAINVDKMIAGVETRDEAKNKPRMNVDITIPSIDLQLNPLMYKNLLRTGEFVSYSKESAMELMETERTKLMAGNSKIGLLYVRETRLRDIVWTKYMCIFKGAYLYFFKNPTDARPAFTYYIRDATVTQRNDLDRPNAFVVENRKNTGYLAGEDEKHMNEWLTVLNSKIQEYSAVNANVFDTGKLDQSVVKPKTAEAEPAEKIDYSVISMSLVFQIKQVKLSLFRKPDVKLFDLETKNFVVNLCQQPGAMEVRLGLESLDIVDYIIEYQNPSLRKLVTSVPTGTIEGGETNADLIEIHVKTLDKTHPNYGEKKTDLEVTMKFGYLFVNLKPNTLSETMKFFLAPPEGGEKKVEKVEKVEVKKAQGQDEIIYTQGTDHTMLRLNVEMKEVSLKLIHKKTHVCMAELALKNTSLSVKMKPLSMEVEGVLGNIQLFDTTNYPNTIDSNVEWEKIVPYEMIGVGAESKNLLDLKFKSLDPRNPEADNENKIYSYVDVKISSIRINLLQQPLLRLIDYLSGQLLPSLKAGDDSTDAAKQVIVTLDKETAEKALANPQFMDMKLNLETPIIVLKPTPTSTEYMEIRLGDLSITSERIKATDRFKNPTKPLEFVYTEKMNILLKDMCMYRVSGDQKFEMSSKVNFDLGMERPLFVDEYKLIYSEDQHITKTTFTINAGMKLTGKMSPMILMLQHEDFLMVMRCLNFNIGYDDGQDKMFLSDYEAVVASQGKPGSPMDINLVFENFTLLACDKKTGLPFAMINLHSFRVNISRDENKNQDIQVLAKELNGSYFENEDGVTLIERKMLGALDRVDRFNIQDVPKEKVVEEVVAKTSSYAQEISKESTSKDAAVKDQLIVMLQMQANGDKVIRITVNELKMYLITSIYLSLLEFISMDASVYPPTRETVEAAPEEKQIEAAKPEAAVTKPEEPKHQPCMTVNLEVKNIIITMPSTISMTKDTPNVLALKGDISFVYATYPSPDLEESISDVKKRNFNRAVEQCAQFNEIGRISVTLHRLEIFVCEFADLLSSKNFNQVKKRNMILPFSLILVRKTHQVCNRERTELINVTKNEVNIERLILRLSYQDVKLINNSLNYQMEQLKQGQPEASPEEEAAKKKAEEEEEKAKKAALETTTTTSPSKLDESVALTEPSLDKSVSTVSEKKEPVEESKEGENPAILKIKEDEEKAKRDDWTPNYEEFNVASKGIQVVIINDAEGSLVPVLEFTMFELLITMIKLPTKMKLSGRVVMNCSYFNPLPSKWEPFVERFGLDFDLTTQQESPKMSVVLSTSDGYEEINLNVSEQMLSILYSTSLTWQEDFKQKKVALDRSKSQVVSTKDKEEDTIDYVSPYTVINHTGYEIEVSADFASMTARPSVARKSIQQSYRIPNGGAAQYLVESDIDKIFERSMQDMFLQTNKIQVQIKHPELKVNPITGIDIDKPKIRGFNLTGTDKAGKDLASSGLQVFSSVQIDKSKKIITISSPYRVVNNVARNYLAVLEANGRTLEITLAEGECSSIPLDFNQGTFALRLDEPGAVTSIKVPIKNFIGVDKVQEFQTGPTSFVAAKSAKVDQANDFYQITFLPPFEVKNCCGLDLFYRFSDNKETAYEMSALKPQETLHETKLGIKQPIYIQIRLQGYYWSQKVLINSPDPKAKLSKEVQVKDATGNLLNILVFFPEGEVGSRKLFLYTKSCIINETPYDILCYNMEDKKKVQIPGQLPTDSQEVFNNKITLYNEANSMTFSRRKQKEHSKTVNVGTMGSTAAELINEAGTSLLDVGVNMSLKRCDKNYNLITKIITLSPRFILINKTDYKIQVKREGGEAVLETLEKDVRTPLYFSEWTSATKAKSISIRPLEDESNPELWNWSNGFDIQAVGLYNYFIKSGDKSQTKFLKTSVTLEHSSLFVVIEEEKLEQLAYKIRNECKTVDILVYQNGDNSSNGYTLKNGQTIPWAWNFPNKKKEVAAAYTVDAAREYHGEDCNYSFDTLNTIVKTKVPAGGESSVRVYSTVIVEGSTRILKFFQPSEIKLDKKKTFLIVSEDKESKPAPVNPSENVINMNVEIAIKGLGISIISSLTANKEKKIKQRREVLYILLRGIEFRMVDSTQLKSSQVRIKYLNIDNNTSYDTSFPVLLTPTKPKDLKAGTKNYFLDALIAQKVTPEVTFYETIQFLLDASTLKVDGMFIDSMMEVANNFSSIFSSDEGADGKGTIAQILYSNSEAAQKLENKDYFITKFDWLYTPISEFAGGNLYIKKLVLNALLFNISFQLKKKDTAEDAFFLLNLLTSVLGTALANLDSAPLTLNGIVLENVFDSKEAITKKIVDKYKDEVTRSIPKLLGSLDIVGNPVGLFTNISSGVVDLFEKPAQGFLQGPLEGGKGILEGAGSLMKNTVSGTFNSIGKVTGSLASGLSNLTMDDEYMAQREKSKMRRPKHLGEGVVQGVTSIFKGVGEGVAGVFTKPIEGASKGGLKGFFKGAFQGVTGLVVKPVTGVLDAAANTAEGIKNTATAFDQKPNESRERYPRAFYGEEKYYRTYMDSDAEVMWLIYFAENAPVQYKQCSMLNSFDVFPDEKEKDHFYILIISLEYIIWWSVKSGNIKWAVETSNIDKMNAFNDGMVIYLKKSTEQVKDKTINIKNCDPQQNAFIFKKLNEVVEYTKQK